MNEKKVCKNVGKKYTKKVFFFFKIEVKNRTETELLAHAMKTNVKLYLPCKKRTRQKTMF